MAADNVIVISIVEKARGRSWRCRAAHRGGDCLAATSRRDGRLFGFGKVRSVVINALRGLEAFANDGHVTVDNTAALGAEFLGDLGADLLQHRLARGTFGDALHMAADGADEGNAHHAGLQLRRRRVLDRHCEGIDDMEMDVALANGAPRHCRQALPGFQQWPATLQNERAALRQAAQRVGVAEHLVVRRNHNLHVLELGVGDFHRFRAQRDVIIRRSAAFLRAIFRRRFGMQVQRAGQDVGQQLAGCHRAVTTHRVETDAEGA